MLQPFVAFRLIVEILTSFRNALNGSGMKLVFFKHSLYNIHHINLYPYLKGSNLLHIKYTYYC